MDFFHWEGTQLEADAKLDWITPAAGFALTETGAGSLTFTKYEG